MIGFRTHFTRTNLGVQLRFYRKRLKPLQNHIAQVNAHQNDLSQAKVYKLRADSPETVERDLRKLGFQTIQDSDAVEDMFVEYLDSSKSPFKKSSQHLNAFRKILSGNRSEDQDRMKVLFNYLLKESEREVRRLENMGPEQLHKLQQMSQPEDQGHDRSEITSEKELEKALIQDLMASSSTKSENSLLPNTESMFRVLSDLNMNKLADADIISVDQMVSAFEISKLLPVYKFKQRGVLLSGHLIYSLGNVRMDPVNESFYIEALVYYGFYKKALELFKSRCKDVKQRWWYEMGMMVSLRANHLRQFDRLLEHTLSTFGDNYVSPKVLRTGIRKKLSMKDFDGSEALTSLFLRVVSTHGWKPSTQEKRKSAHNIMFKDQSQADSFLNEIEHITEADFVAVIQYHLFRGKSDKAIQLLAECIKLPDIGKDELSAVITTLKLHLLKNFDVLKNDLAGLLTEEHLDALRKSYDSAVGKIISDKVRDSCNDILFDSISAIGTQLSLASNIESFILEGHSRNYEDDKLAMNTASHSRKLQGLLKSLLKRSKESKALELLQKMEASIQTGKSSLNENNSALLPPANAHHYAVFVEYYSRNAQSSSNTPHLKEYEKKIEGMVSRINGLNIPYNAVLLTALLTHYRLTSNIDNCFNIINPLLDSTCVKIDDFDYNEELLSFFERREITKPLYNQIWKSFILYFSLFDNGLGITEVRSNQRAWKYRNGAERSKVSVHPHFDLRALFVSMVQKDNILPDVQLYCTVIQASFHQNSRLGVHSSYSSIHETRKWH